MTEAELAKLETKLFGGPKPVEAGAGATPTPVAPPSSIDVERSTIGAPSAEMDTGANAAGYAMVDKMTLGALPWLRDKIADLAGNTTQLRRDEQRAYDEQNHPVAATAGAAAGTAIPALLGAGAAGAAGLTSAAARGAVGAGGANLADQGARAIIDDKPFDPVEAAIATGTGALGNPWRAVKMATAAAHPLAAGGLWAAKKAIGAARGAADDVAAAAATRAAESAAAKNAAADAVDAAAARTAESKASDAAWKAQRKAGMGTQAAEDLSTYAPDDPLAEVARMARAQKPNWTFPELPSPGRPTMEGLRPGKLEPGSPLWEELRSRIHGGGSMRGPPVPPPPPPPAPPGLLDVTRKQLLLPTIGQAALDTASGRAENEQRRKRQRRRSSS